MALNRRLISQNEEDAQVLRTDNRRKFIVCHDRDWQFLFGPDSMISNSLQIVKIGVELDPDTLDSIRFTAYLYNPIDGLIANAATCTFDIYKVIKPGWYETLLSSVSGTIQSDNHYFYAEKLITDFNPTEFDGGPTMMVEVNILRLGEIYKERIYINHLGIYDSFFRLKQEVEFLDVTKLDE